MRELTFLAIGVLIGTIICSQKHKTKEAVEALRKATPTPSV